MSVGPGSAIRNADRVGPQGAGLPTADGSWAGADASLRGQLLRECDAMLRYAYSWGLPVPPAVVEAAGLIECQAMALPSQAVQRVPLPLLAGMHADLAQVIAPAKPGTLCLLDKDRPRSALFAVLGPLANVRRISSAAGLFTAGFVAVSTSPLINSEAVAVDLYALNGVEQWMMMAFLLSAAGMGGCFQALFTAHAYVSQCTYNPRYDASYWMRIGLGLTAGLMLSVLVPLDTRDASVIAKPLLALLGGFSAGLVYRLLQRLEGAVESVFRSPPDRAASESVELPARHAAGPGSGGPQARRGPRGSPHYRGLKPSRIA